MEYSKYIELGFKRTDMNDSVEFNNTGYGGYALELKVGRGLSICVSSRDLDKPKLYVKKQKGETYHIMVITPECVVDICENNRVNNCESKNNNPPSFEHFA